MCLFRLGLPSTATTRRSLRPAAKAAGLDTRKADEIFGTGPIIQEIWTQIWAAAVVIADVTEKNPNVNYELGICHTLGVPTVIITQSLDDVPFDYKHRRCIPYNTTEVDWQRKLKKAITATVKQVLAGEDVVPELGWPYDTSPFRKEHRAGSLVPGSDARDVVIRGVRMVRDAVSYAFGPHGSHVSVNVGHDQHRYYKKGADIASSIHSLERLEEIGIAHARELAKEMRDSVGDGSKTAVLLFQRMLEAGNVALKRNHPVNEVVRGMERAVETVVSAVRSRSDPPSGESISQVARTAAGGDATIASLLVEAFRKAGRDGLIVLERSNLVESTLEVQEGMHFDRGYVDAALVTSAEAQECVLENAYILIYDRKISSMKDLLPVLEHVAKAKRALLVIADDVEGEALATLVVNRNKGILNCLAVKGPGYADRRKAVLQDIAVLTAGNAITQSSGRSLDGVGLQDLGQARKVTVTKDSTTIVGGAGESSLDEYVETVREELSRTTDPYAIEKLQERLANLSGAIVAIRIGGICAQDLADGTYLAESAMHSVRKAIEEGVVVGGGLSLLRAKSALAKLSFKRPGEVAGVNVIADAVEEPTRQLLLNSRVEPAETLKKINRAKTPDTGFNAETGKLQDLGAAGVLDPVAAVTRSVQLAFSHARTLLETGAWDSAAVGVERPPEDAVREHGAPNQGSSGAHPAVRFAE